MSLPAQNVAPQIVAAAGQTVFAFSWRCDDSSLVKVWVNDAADGGFTVIRNADQTASPGGTITRAFACAGGEVVTVERLSPLSQTAAFIKYGPFPADSITTMVDKFVMLSQEASAILAKCVQVARSQLYKFASLEIPVAAAGSALGFVADPADATKVRFGLIDVVAYVDQVLSGFPAVQPLRWALVQTVEGTLNFNIVGALVSSPDVYLVTVDGVPQDPASYVISLSGTPQIQFTEAPPLNAIIIVRSLTYAKAASIGDTSLVLATGSSVSRDLAHRFGEVTNVFNFNVKGDNATDDTARAQVAINATTAGIVVFPPGTYLISQLDMKSNVWIYAEGATFKMPNNSAVNKKLFNFSGVTNCGIFGAFKADGNRANQSNTGNNGQFGVYITGASTDIYIQSGYATGFSEDSLYIGGVGTTPAGIVVGRWVSDNAFRNGVSITNAKNVRFDYLETRLTHGSAPQAGLDIEPNVAADSTANISIGHLITHDNTGYGLQILGVMTALVLNHGDITIERLDSYSNLGSGVLLVKVQRITVLDGGIHDNTLAGIEIARDVQHLRVKANIYKNGQRGVNGALTTQVIASSDWDFSGSVVKNNSQTAGNTLDGMRFDSDDAGKILTRIRAHHVKLFDDQGGMTQRFGFTTGANTSDVDIVGYIPANATGDYTAGSSTSYTEKQRIYKSVALDFPAIAAGLTQQLNAAVTGAAVGDQVFASPASLIDGLVYSVVVSATDTVRVSMGNLTAAPIDPGSVAWKITVIKH